MEEGVKMRSHQELWGGNRTTGSHLNITPEPLVSRNAIIWHRYSTSSGPPRAPKSMPRPLLSYMDGVRLPFPEGPGRGRGAGARRSRSTLSVGWPLPLAWVGPVELGKRAGRPPAASAASRVLRCRGWVLSNCPRPRWCPSRLLPEYRSGAPSEAFSVSWTHGCSNH